MKTHRLYVGTIGEGLWRSVDGGATFTRACDGTFVECHVRALAVDPRDDRVLWMGNELGLWVSRDGASNWQLVEGLLAGLQVWSILLHPADPDLIVVGTCPARLFRSADGGRTWTHSQASITQECPRILWTRVTTIKGDPENKSLIYAGVEIDGLHRSTDAGQSFQAYGEGMSSRDIHDLALVGPGILVAATNNDLNRSSDGGGTWHPQTIGRQMPWPYCRSLAQAGNNPAFLFLGNGDGPPGTRGAVGISADGGLTWRQAQLPDLVNSTIWNFAIHQADPQMVYANSVSGQVFRSWDQGGHWEQLARVFGEIRALAWTP